MDLKELEKNWDDLGRCDALWAILTDPAKRDGGWDPDEFFQTGAEEISRLMAYADALGRPAQRRRALDFGCGVGRLTQALCRFFDLCAGVDIAPSMIALAEKYNRYGGVRCRYYVHGDNDLRLFEAGRFDLIYSSFVLQHMPPEYSRRYVAEFVRTLAPDGLLIFQLTAERVLGATEPMPEGAFNAHITAAHAALQAPAGAPLTLSVSIKNRGSAPWPAAGDREGRYAVHLGNHWLTERGELVRNDDGRATLPRPLPPADATDLLLNVNAPAAPGRYLLELDLVQEAVAWFAQKGSATLRIPVEVVAATGERASTAGPDISPPHMEMYGVPRAQVLAWIQEAGGKLIDTVDLFAPGKEILARDWTSYCYVVTK